MKTQIIKDPNGFFYPMVEVDGEFKFLVAYENWRDGKIFTPPSYETYDRPIAGACRTKEEANGVIERYKIWNKPVGAWEIVE